MSRDTRFQPGRSGNPKGRPPRPRRPNISAFEIILDQRMTATVGGSERELTIEEGLQQNMLKDALAGKRMAIRQVLKMITKREAALSAKNPVPRKPIALVAHYSADNANEAMRLLGIADQETDYEGKRWKLHAWAVQAALSRPGRRRYSAGDLNGIQRFTFDFETLRVPGGMRS